MGSRKRALIRPILLIVTVGIIQAPRVARIARAVAMDFGTQEFVEAARARGEHIFSILWREILPTWPPAVETHDLDDRIGKRLYVAACQKRDNRQCVRL